MKTHVQLRLLARVLAVGVLAAGAVLAPLTARAQTYKVIHYFTGGADGAGPVAAPIFDSSGNLYGTTAGGADAGCSGVGCGVVFELSPNSQGWSETVLYTFTGGSDGGYPEGSLIFDPNGNLYGTADVGGSGGCPFGCGVVFKLSPGSGGWMEEVLYDFQGGTTGYYPLAGLVLDKAGNLYSTMSNGGSANGGMAYQLTDGKHGWQGNILFSFSGNSAGSEPIGAPILDSSGNLYGTTFCCGSGGAVWELLRGSWKVRTLYAFASGGGSGSEAGLVFDKRGNLYGTTIAGGAYSKGVVFKLARGAKGKWKETVLHSFKGGSDGNGPFSTPALDEAGNVYGTTEEGGDPSCDPPYGCGAVFKLTPGPKGKWKETILHRFNGRDGYGPSMEKLVFDAVGNLYGTTVFGGKSGCTNFGCGVVFEITP
jgi:uncharacterized repeat protein (TIGR03803 family)